MSRLEANQEKRKYIPNLVRKNKQADNLCDASVVNRAKYYWTGQDKQLFWKPPKQECCLSSNVAGQKNRKSPLQG